MAAASAPSTSFEDQNQSESMNSTENAIFENSMNNSSAQNQAPDRTSTPLPNAADAAATAAAVAIANQNHCANDSAANRSPSREKSPSWDQQQSNTNASTDNDTLDSEVSIVDIAFRVCERVRIEHLSIDNISLLIPFHSPICVF